MSPSTATSEPHVPDSSAALDPRLLAAQRTQRRESRRAVERIVLPPFRVRARDGFWYAGLTLVIPGVLLPFVDADGSNVALKMALYFLRSAILFACCYAMPARASAAQVYALLAVAAAGVFGSAGLLSVIRGDMSPQVVFHVIVLATTATMFPWGVKAQALLSATAAATLLLTRLWIDPTTGHVLSLEATTAAFVAFGIGIGLSAFLERSRSGLATLIEDSRLAEEELEHLHATLEERVAQRTVELEFANLELQGFTYAVSHDLRGPLRSVSGYSKILLEERDEILDDDARHKLQRIRAAGLRMDAILDDLLLLARVGRTALRYEAVDLGEMARSILHEYRVDNRSRSVEVSIDSVPLVRGDRGILLIAMENLLENAWKFSSGQEVAHLSITGKQRGDQVVVRITDDGIGFDMRYRDRLFRPFERIHDDARFEGLGIGLATVARVAHRHGGEVDAEGQLGRGATFSMTLPAATSHSAESDSRPL